MTWNNKASPNIPVHDKQTTMTATDEQFLQMTHSADFHLITIPLVHMSNCIRVITICHTIPEWLPMFNTLSVSQDYNRDKAIIMKTAPTGLWAANEFNKQDTSSYEKQEFLLIYLGIFINQETARFLNMRKLYYAKTESMSFNTNSSQRIEFSILSKIFRIQFS